MRRTFEKRAFPRGRRVFYLEWTPRNYIAVIVALAAVYYGASKLGFAMAYAAEQVTVVWPPTGIALACVLLMGNRVWPGIALGAFFANVTTHEPFAVACGIALGNTLEALAGAFILRRFLHFDNSLGRVRDVLGLFVAAVLAPMLSATIGVACLCAGGVQPWEAFHSLWLLWWLGDMTGALIVAPALLVWGSNPYFFWEPRDIFEILALIIGVVVTSVAVFTELSVMGIGGQAFIYFVFPFTIWAALRFGQRGTTYVTLATSAAAIWATIHKSGPFAAEPISHSLPLLQIFMGVVAVTGLFLGAAVIERRRSEGKRVMLAAIVQSSQDAIIGRDLSGTINFWNDGAERLLGYSAAEAIGKSDTLIIPPDEREKDDEIMQRLRRGEQVEMPFETTRLTKDGRLLAISLTVSPIRDDNGRIIGGSQIARDITEQKRSEEALREADRRKNEFLATLAHELRNPLAPLSNALRVLQQPKITPALFTEALGIMDCQLRHTVRLVDDLLDVSRISHGKVELRRERITLGEIISNALETTKPVIEANRHRLVLQLPDNALWLDGDLTRLSQVFANLLNNAAKYTPAGGTISLKATASGNHVEVRIADTGIGIPADMLPVIFGMFRQVDSSMERAHGGLGIGLTLVKSFVEMHGGSVQAHSAGNGKGSEFTVRLPLVSGPAVAATPVAPSFAPAPATAPAASRPAAHESFAMPAPAGKARLRVLVVDDNPTLAKTLGWMVEILGHDVAFAHDGAQALSVAREYRPDVILLDIGLPGMNGYEVGEKLRAEPALRNAILVAQTGWGQQEHRDRSRAAGFDHHFVKPVTMNTLEELFQSLAERAPLAEATN